MHVRSMSPLAKAFPSQPSSPKARMEPGHRNQVWGKPNSVLYSTFSARIEPKHPKIVACVRLCSPIKSAMSSPRRIRLHERAMRKAANHLAECRSHLSLFYSQPYHLRLSTYQKLCLPPVPTQLKEAEKPFEITTSGMQTEEETELMMPTLKTVYLRPTLLPLRGKKRHVI